MAKNPSISNLAAKDACDSITSHLDDGAGAGLLRIYDGAQPADVDTAITSQKLLAELTLFNPAFPAAVDGNPGGQATANSITDESSAVDNGTASWFRAVDSNGVAHIDGSCGTSNADLILDSVSITAGQTVKVNSWIATQKETN